MTNMSLEETLLKSRLWNFHFLSSYFWPSHLDTVRKSHPISHIESPKLANSIGESVECELCQYAMGYLDALLGEKATEDEIVNAVKNLCSYLPEYINTQVIESWLLVAH